jgi:hypothetical protein
VADAAFGYVNVFRARANVGFFHGAELDDPKRLLEGTGKRMRHVKVKPGVDLGWAALAALIRAAYKNMKLHLAQADGSASVRSSTGRASRCLTNSRASAAVSRGELAHRGSRLREP